MSEPTEPWAPASWRAKAALQQPKYDDPAQLERYLRQIAALPPIVTSGEIEQLKAQLAEVADGKRFILQGGDCLERFEECRPRMIAKKLRVLLQMSLVLIDASKMKVTRIGRMAGQYAKPRSNLSETRDGVTLPAFQGDLINAPGFSAAERRADASRLFEGYVHSAMTLNFVRGMVTGDFSNLEYPDYWDLSFAEYNPHAASYRDLVNRIVDSLQFMEASVGAPLGRLTRFDFFTSHEALLLPYEEAVTHQVPFREGWFNQGAHLPWIGDRTRALTGAHVEYCRGIVNPVGVKVGPTMTADELVALARALNPGRVPGKVVFIYRFGVGKIEAHLPPLLEAARRDGVPAVWCCDPMHGNTVLSTGGRKTRRFDDILGEVRKAFEVHSALGVYLGGIHLELTGEDVTECLGGEAALADEGLEQAYQSLVDPRLNHEQSLEMALQVGQLMRKWQGARR